MTTHEANLRLLVHDLQSHGYLAECDGTHGFAFTEDTGYEGEEGAVCSGSIAWNARYAIATLDFGTSKIAPSRKVIPFTHMDTLAASLDTFYQDEL